MIKGVIILNFVWVSLFGLGYIESSNGLIPPSLDGGRTEVEFCDLNEDGDVDLVSIGDHGNPYINTDQHGIIVWFGDGTGNWSSYMNGNFGYGGIAVGDANNDGNWDVGYGMHHNYSGTDFGDQLMEVALGDGTGHNWTPWDDNLATQGQNWGMFASDFADIDNDGDLDFGSVSFGSDDGVWVYLNNLDGTWENCFGFSGGNSTMHFVFGDFNRDGNGDFAVGHQYGMIYIGDGTGGFSHGDGNLPPPGNLGHFGVAVGDVNNDGCDDIGFTNSNGGIELWIYTGPNTWQDFSGNLPNSGSYEAVQLFDMDVDGNLDLCGFGNSLVTIWTGDGTGNWTKEAEFNTPTPGDFKAFRVGGDCDHNGYPDIVLVCRQGSWPNDRNYIHFYKETSTPSQLSIKPINPHGNERYYSGSVQFIDWISSVPSGNATVDLDLSTSGPSGPWTNIASSLPDNGRHQWQVPQASSDNCYIRYVVTAGANADTAVSLTSFEIISQPRVEGDTRLESGLRILPNPTRSRIIVEYSLSRREKVEISAYDASGRLIKRLLTGLQGPGRYQVTWSHVSPGVYYLAIRTNGTSLTEKVVLF
ncbi:MAG TPA: T9SS type A sorting domain-containing protein [bacterium (Candidatus Stahlbacteria)]|nr:T9SS type A sorting domain-containing protein [Candidatus Stahlbacteria bacterium]